MRKKCMPNMEGVRAAFERKAFALRRRVYCTNVGVET